MYETLDVINKKDDFEVQLLTHEQTERVIKGDTEVFKEVCDYLKIVINSKIDYKIQHIKL